MTNGQWSVVSYDSRLAAPDNGPLTTDHSSFVNLSPFGLRHLSFASSLPSPAGCAMMHKSLAMGLSGERGAWIQH